MERDFMGLKKDAAAAAAAAAVKEEAAEGCKDFSRVSGMPWPLSSKVSALHSFMPFKASYEERTPKLMPETVVSQGFIPVSAPDAFETNQKRIYTEIQHNNNSLNFSRDAKMLSAAQRPISFASGNSFFGSQFVGNSFKQQLLGGSPVASPHPVPSPGSVVGTTHSRFAPKNSAGPPQLTIFYAGTVNVFDEISPEKAQAIMLLAGNGNGNGNVSSMISSQPRAQVQMMCPASKPNLLPISTPPSSALSSPLSVSSHPANNPSGSGSATNDEMTVNLAKNTDSPRIVASVGPLAAMATLMPNAVPQARKASLARFLEKRKERVMNAAAPYYISKKDS
ncbi:protein TIFY 6B [Impatiens glandulifera]|uniref:protein TIFY 6B n=1 Tax=Impatiens glandulifera TaxID=253017 RepID=UPI001FB0C252|nr:protein TIFY 6B [Impatiens glandulifera]